MEKKDEELKKIEKLSVEELKELMKSLSKEEIYRLFKIVMETGEVHD